MLPFLEPESEPTDFEHERDRELTWIAQSRMHRNAVTGQKAYDDSVGLALSGGGIRSATVSVGALQELAKLRVLHIFDYISSVSGGGYASAWLLAWARRPSTGILTVQECLSQKAKPVPELEHLRKMSNYLTPNLDLLAADRWTFVATLLLNLSVNSMSVGGLILSFLYIPLVGYALVKKISDRDLIGWTLIVCLGMMIVALFFEWLHLSANPAHPKTHEKIISQRESHYLGLAAHCFSGILVVFFLKTWIAHDGPDEVRRFLLVTVSRAGLSHAAHELKDYFVPIVISTTLLVIGVLYYSRGLMQLLRRIDRRFWPFRWLLVFLGSTISIGAALLLVVPATLRNIAGVGLGTTVDPPSQLVLYIFAPLAALLWWAVVLAGLLAVSISRNWADRAHEFVTWLLGRWLLTGIVVCTLSLFAMLSPMLIPIYGSQLLFVLVLAVLALIVGGVGARRSRSGEARRPFRHLIKGAGIILGALLVTCISYLNIQFFANESLKSSESYLIRLEANIDDRMGPYWATIVVLTFLGSAVIGSNRFSLNSFYRKQLIRCYINASDPDPESLKQKGGEERDMGLASFESPGPHAFPVYCASLNIMSATHLAWQQRKACSFVFTPLACGFTALNGLPAYAETKQFAFDGGIGLGRAIAISGAAISSNMGFHSSRTSSFLFTVLNLRLGWWLPNPARHTGIWAVTRNHVVMLAKELFGLTNELSDEIYVSDGGHFENTAIYELVQRRCRTIIAIDAGEDPRLTCHDLANAVLKCRIDFRVEVDFEKVFTPGVICAPRNIYALARVRYFEAGQGPDGVLLYIKACKPKKMPLDVVAYADRHDSFPHQPTDNQWFTESQFESYRALGEALMQQVFTDLAADPSPLARQILERLHSAASSGVKCDADKAASL
ncbi:MAG TPA: patatin-like phospholipase family protein [Bryobacteraceae bacterium]|nr:patatin-like phospholipase family protein [Bryobacteraceae bacterium]